MTIWKIEALCWNLTGKMEDLFLEVLKSPTTD